MKNKFLSLKKFFLKNDRIYFVVLILFSFYYLFPMISGYPLGDDTFYHAFNIKLYGSNSIYLKIFPEVANNLGWGGAIFYPPLPHVLGGLIMRLAGIFNLSNIFAMKVIKALILFFSAFSMYILANKIYKNKKYAVIVSMIYISSSYFLVDFYMRDALNEAMLFIFVPLVFLSFFYLFEEKRKDKFYLSFIVGYVGMIYSHLVLTVIFTLFFVPFLLLYLKDIFKNKNYLSLVLASFIVICFTSTFIFPLLEHMIIDLWVIPLYDDVWVLPFKGYFYYDIYKTVNSFLFIKLLPIAVVLSVVGIKDLLFKRNLYFSKKYILGIYIFTILTLIISGFSPFWEVCPRFLKNIQFAWRLTLFVNFGVSILAGAGLNSVYNIFKDKYKYIFTILLFILIFSFSYDNFKRINKPTLLGYDYNFDITDTTTDYFPKNAKKDLDYLEEFDSNSIRILNGVSVDLKVINNNVPKIDFSVKNISEGVVLELPRFYYLGYSITDANGKSIKYFETKHGLIGIKLKKDGIYKLRYKGTVVYEICIGLKFLSLSLIALLVFRFKRKGKGEI